MNAIEILKDLAVRPRGAADALSGSLTAAALNAHPGGHPNSIAWLLWHAAREMDVQVAALSGEEAVWTAQGYDERFGLGLDPDDMGYGHDAEQAGAIRADDPALLIEHLRAVTDALLRYLDTLTESDLDDIVDEDWDPPVTRGARLVSAIDDAAQHVGQAAYIAGIPADD